MAAAVGPCYTADGIARVLHRSADDLEMLVYDCLLLALTTADGHAVFPAFQLDEGHITRGLSRVLSALREGIHDPWTWALWLNSTPPVIAGIAPEASRIQQLIDGEFHIVLRAAKRSASSWRS